MMVIGYDPIGELWIEVPSGLEAESKQSLLAMIKRKELGLPEHSFLSNRYVLERIVI